MKLWQRAGGGYPDVSWGEVEGERRVEFGFWLRWGWCGFLEVGNYVYFVQERFY